jgi:nitroreductase
MIELLRSRRSIRKFTKKQIDESVADLIREMVLRAPSSRGINPWEFVIVDDPDLLMKLSTCKPHGSGFVKDAGLALVVCADETKTDVWVEDCSIAAIIVQLGVHSMGLGSCWVQVRNRMYSDEHSAEKYIQELLSIPSHVRVECIIAVGYPDENKPGWSKDKLQYDKIHKNTYMGSS